MGPAELISSPRVLGAATDFARNEGAGLKSTPFRLRALPDLD
jgi:hypothetical protein